MKKYIATFFSHFGAIHFSKQCAEMNIKAKMMPVPRDLSSSCGTCVLYEASDPNINIISLSELEQLVQITENGYLKLYNS